MGDFEEHDNYSHVNEHHEENGEEDGIVEYLEIDNEVMDTLQDPNGYFAQVNQSHPAKIYVQQSSTNTQQLSLVIQNHSSSNEYTSLKQISSHQLDDHNGVTNVLWSNNIPNSNDNKSTITTEDSHKSSNGRGNSKTKRKRKTKSSNSHDNNSKHLNKKKVVSVNKGKIQNQSDSLDLFFQSMAQTVSHLPSRVQAKIKMDICNVISMAEIKYCPQPTNSHNNLNRDLSSKN